jgi:hypothetical protein
MTPSSDLKDLAVRAGRDRTRSCDASCDVIDFDPGQTRTYRRPTLVCNTHLLSSPQNVPPHKLGETLVAPKQILAHTSRFRMINSFSQTLVTLHDPDMSASSSTSSLLRKHRPGLATTSLPLVAAAAVSPIVRDFLQSRLYFRLDRRGWGQWGSGQRKRTTRRHGAGGNGPAFMPACPLLLLLLLLLRMRTTHCPWRSLQASTSSRNDRVRFRAMEAGSQPRRSAGTQPAFLGTDLGLGSSGSSLCPRRERQTLNRLTSVVVQSDQGADMGGWEEASVRRVATKTRHLKSRGFKLLEKRKRKYDGLESEQSLIGFH